MNYTGSVRHGVVIRLAELYLIAAEAELFLNDNASGTSYINEVREKSSYSRQGSRHGDKAGTVDIGFYFG